MLISMLDGGIVDYADDQYHFDGCETCDYGSEYITEINLSLTKYEIYLKTNQMYSYAISEGQMIRLFLTEYNAIQQMTEAEFIEWFKRKVCEITHDDFQETVCGRKIERFDVEEL